MRSWDRASFALNTVPTTARLWRIVLIAAIFTSLALFVFASRQMARYREYAAEI